MKRDMIIKAEEKFPISGQGYMHGKLLDNTECSILIDAGASKPYMSKSYYISVNHFMHCKVCLNNTKRSGRQRTMCSSTICDSHNS